MTGSRNDALIKGGQIVDGTGAKPFTADVRVADGKIVEIGSNLKSRTEPTFDASGCYVTPGFIDTHAHYDGSLFWDPACDPITLHGVTTVLIGNCGLGLAPVHKEQIKGLAHLFSYIEDIPRDVFETAVPWSWDSFPQYAKIMRTRTFGVNVATLISHSLLRTDVLGDDAWKRSSTPEEAGRIAKTYDEALAAGAFGFSTSNFDRSPSGDPVPSCHGDQHEFEQLFAVTAKHKGIVQVIPDLSSMDNQEKDLRRLGDLSSRHGGVPVISNGIYQRPDKPDYASRMMSVARDIRSKGANFHFLASPRSIDLVVNMREAMVFLYVPAWNEITQPDVSDADKQRYLADTVWRARARRDWDAVKEGFPSGNVIRQFRIINVGKPEYEHFLGKTFDGILDQRQGHPSDVLADWLLENDLRAEFVYPFTNTDQAAVGKLLAADENLISGSDAGAHIGMFDGAGDTTLVLTRHVRDRHDMTLEEAVKRLSSDQANLLGLAGRGTLKIGAHADIAVFDLTKLDWQSEKKVNDIPGGRPRFRRPPGGFRFTFVNGVLVQQNGMPSGALPARFLGVTDKVAA